MGIEKRLYRKQSTTKCDFKMKGSGQKITLSECTKWFIFIKPALGQLSKENTWMKEGDFGISL
jgi:hypothetical protein